MIFLKRVLNILGYRPISYIYHTPIQPVESHQINSGNIQSTSHPDGSYSYSYSTPNQAKQESADSKNNVRGNFWYINKAGSHDLSYVAGSSTGFQPTGGSLAVPNGLLGNIVPYSSYYLTAPHNNFDNSDDQSGTGDASYNFSIDTDTYKRSETADASGSIEGIYSYVNEDGLHDLSYKAGSDTGFVATGGSLATPNGVSLSVSEKHKSRSLDTSNNDSSSGNDNDSTTIQPNEDSSGDASYSFEIDTPNYKRQESSDATGNVKGRYSYINEDGNHDLSYEAGSSTGFHATGGSLKDPPGAQHRAVSFQTNGRESSKLIKGSLVKTYVIPLDNTGDLGYVIVN